MNTNINNINPTTTGYVAEKYYWAFETKLLSQRPQLDYKQRDLLIQLFVILTHKTAEYNCFSDSSLKAVV